MFMRLNKIYIENFRNIKSLNIENFNDLNIFLGRNAQGKSNFIEALYCLGLGKSYKSRKEEELLEFSSDFAVIIGYFNDENINFSIGVSWEKSNGVLKKTIKHNENIISKFSDFLKVPFILCCL